MWRFFSCLIALSALLASQPAIADTVAPIARTSRWNVNYDDDSCSLLGSFGDGKDQIVGDFTWFSPGSAFDLRLYGTLVPPGGAVAITQVVFGPDGKKQDGTALIGKQGDRAMAILSGIGFARPDSDLNAKMSPHGNFDQGVGLDWLEVRLNSRRRRLILAQFVPALAAVRACLDDLVTTWKYDPKVQATLSRPLTPTSEPGTWLSSNDFPASALERGQNGLVHFRLDVAEDGAVAGCHLQMEFKDKAFDALSCDLLRRRARFKPALDKDGRPIRSFYVNSIKWLGSADS